MVTGIGGHNVAAAHTHPTPAPATYSIEEAAQILGVGRSAAYEAARRGEIPTIRIGRRLRVPRRALDRLLDGEIDEPP
jgi:excisionase family DNA binding protein